MDLRAKQRNSGGIRQSGLAPAGVTPATLPALFVRGVVVATYVVDDPRNPDLLAGATPTAVYCDVLTYQSHQGAQRVLLPRCLVCQDFGNIQSGVIYRPRAASLDVSGQPLDLGSCAIGQLDGDHVLCSFLDGNRAQPIVVRGLPHPSSDIGQQANQGAAGAHLQLRLVDGSPYLVKNQGAYFGVDASGSFVTDTRYANDGSLQSDGSEPAPAQDGSLGNQVARLHANAQKLTELYDMTQPTAPVLALQEILTASQKLLHFDSQSADFQITDAAGPALHVQRSGPSSKLQLGDGAVHPAIAEHLQTLYTQLYGWLIKHTHATAVGASSPPLAPAPPSYDVAINSSHVSFPDL